MLLPLDDERWATLCTHFGHAENVPGLIRAWQAAIGTPAEDGAYEILFEHALHQLTLSSCVYAVVPYLVLEMPRCAESAQIRILGDVGVANIERPLSESDVDRHIHVLRNDPEIPDVMREHFVNAAIARSPFLPPYLERAWHDAVDAARAHAIELLRVPGTPTNTARLLGTITALFVPTEQTLARALLQPRGLSITAEYGGKRRSGACLATGTVRCTGRPQAVVGAMRPGARLSAQPPPSESDGSHGPDAARYPLRPPYVKVAFGIGAFFAVGAYSAYRAITPHGDLLINGLIRLGPTGASIFFGVVALAALALSAAGLSNIVRMAIGPPAVITCTATQVVVVWRGTRTDLPRHGMRVSEVKYGRQRFLVFQSGGIKATAPLAWLAGQGDALLAELRRPV